MKNSPNRVPDARRGVVIAGAYGMDNAGDDASLAAIAAAPVRARGLGRLNAPGWLLAMGRARLFILGGGSLLQDVTSGRSLWYYLLLLRAAKAMGCATMLYGAGAGPISSEKARQRAARYLNEYADVISARDQDTLTTLADWGVTAPRMLLGADPALSLAPAAGERERRAGFVLRSWPGFWDHVSDFAQAARYVWERYKLAPVFFCLSPDDRKAAKSVCAALHDVPCQVSSDPRRVGRMGIVVAMRLHGLVFALREGVPAGGVSYDPKVDAFCKEAGLPMVALEDVTAEDLQELIDFAMHLDGEHLSASLRTLRAREKTNLSAAAELLAEE